MGNREEFGENIYITYAILYGKILTENLSNSMQSINRYEKLKDHTKNIIIKLLKSKIKQKIGQKPQKYFIVHAQWNKDNGHTFLMRKSKPKIIGIVLMSLRKKTTSLEFLFNKKHSSQFQEK